MSDYLADFGFVLLIISTIFLPVIIICGILEHSGLDEKMKKFIVRFLSDDEAN